jgi:hemoglobin
MTVGVNLYNIIYKRKTYTILGVSAFACHVNIIKGGTMQKFQKKTEKSLYERLGGYDAIAAIVNDYIRAMRADPQFSRFSGGRGTDKKNRDLQLNIDILCSLTGGPCYYMGRDMKTSHAGLVITESEWDAQMKYIASALDKFKVPQKEKEEVLTIIENLKRDIVE